jgi:hypothetical protein
MRYRVEFRYREDTGEVEVLQIDTVETGQRAADHDAQHDRVAAELASVVEQYADIDEVGTQEPALLRRPDDPGAPPGDGRAVREDSGDKKQELREQSG